jgi:predicted outer membrane protein
MTHTKSAPRSSYATIPIGILAAVVTMGACTTYRPPSYAPPSSAAQEARPRYGATMMQPSDRGARPAVTATPSSSAGAAVSDAELATLDDAHLAGLIEEVNDGAARFASVGERRVTGRQVKRFAHDLATRHAAAKSRFLVRLAQLGIEPASGPVSEQVHADEGGDLETLPGRAGQDFDRAYVDGQLRDLTRAADLLGRIIARVQRPDLTAALEDLRSRLDADIRGAESFRDSLREGTTNRTPDAYDPDKLQR